MNATPTELLFIGHAINAFDAEVVEGSDLATSAVEYAASGLPVFRLVPRNKTPLDTWGVENAVKPAALRVPIESFVYEPSKLRYDCGKLANTAAGMVKLEAPGGARH